MAKKERKEEEIKKKKKKAAERKARAEEKKNVTAIVTARKRKVNVKKKVDVQVRKSERIRKQVTTHSFENSSNLEESAEPKLLDYSFDSKDDTHPCIYCSEPFKELCANESWLQCTEPSCLKWAHCLCAGVNSHMIY